MSGAVEGVLLPCPFCGGTDGDLVETFTRATDTLMIWAVECERCGAERASDASEYEAREFWNTRTTPPARSYADGVEDAAKAVEALRREVPYEYNKHPCSTTMRRAAAAIRLLSQGEKA
jgi:Lar family restriction alleviation protein